MAARLLELGSTQPLRALAIEEAVLASVDHGSTDPAWISWIPDRRCLVLGTARPAAGDILTEAARADGVPVLRRRSGGGTVALGPETPVITLVGPAGAGIREAYEEFCGTLAAVLLDLGVESELHRPADLAAAGRKVAGLAQRRLRRAALVTASVVARPMADVAARLLAEPAGRDAPAYRAGRRHADFMTSLAELGVSRPEEEIAAGLRRWLLGRGVLPVTPSQAELAAAAKIAAELSVREWIERF